jgi:excisionase family DNA binding protein
MAEESLNIELLTLKEAAQISPYSAEYLNLLARKERIRARKIGRDWLVTRADLFDYLKKQQTESKSKLMELSKYINLLM